MFHSLLATKFHVPGLRSNLVDRPRLTQVLDDAVRQNHRLILLSAPAGFGKTTLVSSWLQTIPYLVAWLSLEGSENDGRRFWRHVISAFQTVDGAVGGLALSMLQSHESPPLEIPVAALINDLLSVPQVILVLDDYHVIESDSIHASLNFFLDHLPNHISLVIITRVDPPLALARRRSRAQLTETRSADLRFTLPETADFLDQVAGVELLHEDVVALAERTDGWVAGIQLAALSLRQQPDKHAFVQAFSGDDRFVMDYLVEEVLQQQPPEIKEFLLKTSILDRFCAQLVAHMLYEAESPAAPLCIDLPFNHAGQPLSIDQFSTQIQQVLESLELANLFLFPLDNRRCWYRYHPLFADMLQLRLRQEKPADEIRGLYRRAARWYEREGDPSQAISLALAASDIPEAMRLLEQHVLTVFYRSETRLVYQWLKSLPEETLRHSPLLCAVYANAIALAPPYPPQTVPAAQKWMDTAEELVARLEQNADCLSGDLLESYLVSRAFLLTLRAYMARYRGDAPAVILPLIQEALSALPAKEQASNPNYQRFHGALLNNLSLTYWSNGQTEAAARTSIEARRICEESGDYFNAFSATYFQAVITRRYGRMQEAEVLCRGSLQSLSGNTDSERRTPFAGTVYIALGQVYLEWNRLEQAEQAILTGLSLLDLTLGSNVQSEGYVALARIKQAQGNKAAAWQALDEADKLWAGARVITDLQRVRLWLSQAVSDPDAFNSVHRWAGERGLLKEDGLYHAEPLVLLRVYIALRRRKLIHLHATFAFLGRQMQLAQAGGWAEWQIELYILYALAYQAEGDETKALDMLQRALELAQPGKYVRIFVDEGEPLRQLLYLLNERLSSEYLRQILQAFLPPLTGGAAARQQSLAAVVPDDRTEILPELIEPLTPRELEVLHLLVNGFSNSDIATRLAISYNTAKKHVIHIFEKLGASNRLEAANLARALGLIP